MLVLVGVKSEGFLIRHIFSITRYCSIMMEESESWLDPDYTSVLLMDLDNPNEIIEKDWFDFRHSIAEYVYGFGRSDTIKVYQPDIFRIFYKYLDLRHREKVIWLLCWNLSLVYNILKSEKYVIIETNKGCSFEFSPLCNDIDIEELKVDLLFHRMVT